MMSGKLIEASLIKPRQLCRKSIPYPYYLLFHGDKPVLEDLCKEIFEYYPDSHYALEHLKTNDPNSPFSPIRFSSAGVSLWGISFLVQRRAWLEIQIKYNQL